MDTFTDLAQRLCDRILAVNLFSKVGTPTNDETVVEIRNWNEVIPRLQGIEWENYQIDQSNEFGLKIQAISVDLYNRWNEVSDKYFVQIKPHIMDCFTKLNLPDIEKEVTSSAKWDLGHALIEQFYSVHVSPGFFTNLAEWYIKGHYPCGWIGIYPEGKCIVY